MQRHPVLGVVSILVGTGLAYLVIAEMAQSRQPPHDWTIVLPGFFVTIFVAAGVLLLLGRKVAYLVAVVAWSSLTALFVLFLLDPPPNRDIALSAAVFAVVGASVVGYLLAKSRAAEKGKPRAVRLLDGMQNRLRSFVQGAPFWQRLSRVAGMMGVFAMALWAIEGGLFNFIFWTAWAIFFLGVGTYLSAEANKRIHVGIFLAGVVGAVWIFGRMR